MKRILSHAERMAQFNKQAQEATRQAKNPPVTQNKKNDSLQGIKKKLAEMGYQILDEQALEEIIGKDTSLQLDKLSILSEKGVITLNEQELDKSKPKAPVVFSISEADIPQTETSQNEQAPTKEEKDEKEDKKEETLNRIQQIKQKQEEKKADDQSNPKPRQPSQDTSSTSKEEVKEEVKEEEVKKEAENKPTTEPTNKEILQEIKAKNFAKKYTQSLTQWCQKNINKETKQAKRKIKSAQSIKTNSEEETQIEVTPLNPKDTKRGDKGAIYKIKKSPQKDHVDITLGSAEPGKPLNYDYFYALVKAAHDSGADTIEFNNIKTPEFRDKLLAAALQFKMKLKNPPGVINLDATHIQSIPPGCRHYLELHNERAKKALQEMGKQITPEKGTKFGTGPKAEERTHAEKVWIESKMEMEKARKAIKAREGMEKRLNSPSDADYDQHPENYVKSQNNNKQKKRYIPRQRNSR